MLKFYKIGLTLVNCFLIQSKDGYLLVDTGMKNNYDLLINKLKKKDVSLNDITHIILTHHHYDHSGLLSRLLKENPNIKLIVHEKELKSLSKGKTISGEVPLFVKPFKYLLGLKSNYLDFDSVFVRKGDIVIEKNDFSLKKIGVDAKIVLTPGHTDGSISIIFGNGESIVGDLIINIPFLKGYKPFVAFNYKEISKSLEKLKNLGATFLYPSHGSKIHIDEVLKTF